MPLAPALLLAFALETAALEISPRVLLLDHGSKRPASTLALRATAALVQARLGCAVEPVSVAYSDAVPPARLDGSPARLLRDAVAEMAANSQTDQPTVIVPLFLGPSHALSGALDEAERELNAARRDGERGAALRSTGCLVDERGIWPASAGRVACAMAELVTRVARERGVASPLKATTRPPARKHAPRSVAHLRAPVLPPR